MILDRKTGGSLWVMLGLLAAALISSGCAATHVGEAWQCPVKQGVACASVAEADPAVISTGKAGRITPDPAEAGALLGSGATCTGGCGLLAWFAELLGFGGENEYEEAFLEALSTSFAEETKDPADENLRTKERIARIWIAPFVDEEGLYREGHWVRVVIEPAGWRLP